MPRHDDRSPIPLALVLLLVALTSTASLAAGNRWLRGDSSLSAAPLAAPDLLLATYLGGSQRFGDLVHDVAVDGSGAIYLTGETFSADFPTLGAAQGSLGGESDAFVTKLSADGSTLLYSTFLGGAGRDAGLAIAVDAQGRAVVAGETVSSDFPTINALQAESGGDEDAFLAVLAPSGASLELATYLGGRDIDSGLDLALTADGDAILVGHTFSRDFPRLAALQDTLAGPSDAFAAHIDLASGTPASPASLRWSTFLGGSSWDAAAAVALDASGTIHLAGTTGSADFPAPPGSPATHAGGDDAFLARLSADGATLLAGGLVGGSGDESGAGVAVDATGRTVLVGGTSSADLPVEGGSQPTAGGGEDGLLARLTADGAAFDLVGYLGGAAEDALFDVAVDVEGGLLVAGRSASPGWPTGSATFGPGGDLDLLLARLSDGGAGLDWATRVGGSDNEGAEAMALDAAGNVALAGYAAGSTDWPVTAGAVQPAYAGGSFDGIVARLGNPDAVLPTATAGAGEDGATRLAFVRMAGAEDAARVENAAGQAASGRFDLFVANRFGGGAALIVGGPDDIVAPSWDPLCRTILFSRGRRPLPATPTPTRVVDPTAPPPSPTPTIDAASAVGLAPGWFGAAAIRTLPGLGLFARELGFASTAAHAAAPAQAEEPFELWTVHADGSDPTRLTNTAWSELDAAWSPDGTRIAYAASRGGQWNLWVADADGTNARQLTNTPLEDRDPAWSPDGATIAYTCNVARQLELCVIDAAGGEPAVLLEAPGSHESAPAWSPDGATIAFVRETFADRRGDIWTMAADGTGALEVAWGPGDERDPAWAPDGALLFDTDGQPQAGDAIGDAAAGTDGPSRFDALREQEGAAPATLLQTGRRAIWELPDWQAGNDALRRVEGVQPDLCREPREATPRATASPSPTGTPAAGITVTPSPTTAPTPVGASPTPRPSPTFTPTPPSITGISGQFLAVTSPRATPVPIPLLPDGAVFLVVQDGLAQTPLRQVRPASDGRFHFTDLPLLRPGTHFAVLFEEPRTALAADLLMRWQSPSIDVAPDGHRDLGAIDLTEPKIEAEPGVVQRGMPLRVRFQTRLDPAEEVLIVLREVDSGEVVYSSEPFPAIDGGYTFAELPRVLSAEREYSWEVVIAPAAAPTADGGSGIGFPTFEAGSVGLSRTRGRLALEAGPTVPRPTIRVPIPTHGGTPPASVLFAAARAVAPSAAQASAQHASEPAPLGLPLAMNQHTPGVLVELLRQSGAVVGGQYVARPAPISGPGATGIQVQNLASSGDPAEITAAFYEQYDPYDPGQLFSQQPAAAHRERRSAAPGAAANIYLPTSDLPFPTSYSALIDGAGADLAAIYRADWPSTGGAAIYSNVAPSDELVVPLVLRNFSGQNSVVTLQNLSPPESDARLLANVRLRLYAAGSTAVASERHIALRKGQSVTVDLGSVHPAFTRLGEGFVGSMRIVADSLIGAQALIGAGARSVSGFEAVPLEAAARELYVPLFRAGQPGLRPGDRLDTGISVVNPGDEEVEVVVDFRPTVAEDPRLAACRAAPRYLQRATIPAGSSKVFYQGAGGRVDMAPAMPEPCFGSATIRATGGVLAIVQDGQNGTELLSAYNAVPADQAAERVAVPLFRNDHSAYRLTTGIQVMNVGDEPAEGVRITFRSTNPDGGSTEIACGAACVVDIPAGGSHTFWPGDPALRIPPGTYGAAVIESPRPVAVIVNDYPLTGAVDAATYNGIPMR